MRRLLFLNGIKAFEAAARSGSFAGAGLELNVSAAAKLPLRAAASNALMPLRNSSRRMSPSGKLTPGQDISVCAGNTSKAGRDD